MKAVKIEAPGGLDLVRPVTWLYRRFGAGWGEAIPLDPRLGLWVEHILPCQKLVVAVQS